MKICAKCGYMCSDENPNGIGHEATTTVCWNSRCGSTEFITGTHAEFEYLSNIALEGNQAGGFECSNRLEALLKLRGVNTCHPSFKHCQRCCLSKQCHETFKVVKP